MIVWTSAALFGILAIFISSLNDGKYQDALFAVGLAIPFYLAFWFFNKFGFKKEVEKTLHFFNSIGLTKNGK
jgi:cytochrome c biogenesis protein CcdA